MWRGRLPHWRADEVRYYLTFRHRRDLDDAERLQLLKALLRHEGRKWDLMILCVLPSQTEMIFTVREKVSGDAYELSEIVERAKAKAGREILKHSNERFPPFYAESYDRIVRDDAELEERLQSIFESPVEHELVEAPENYPALWVANMPQ